VPAAFEPFALEPLASGPEVPFVLADADGVVDHVAIGVSTGGGDVIGSAKAVIGSAKPTGTAEVSAIAPRFPPLGGYGPRFPTDRTAIDVKGPPRTAQLAAPVSQLAAWPNMCLPRDTCFFKVGSQSPLRYHRTCVNPAVHQNSYQSITSLSDVKFSCHEWRVLVPALRAFV
jgi:hypothetical protein